MWARLHPPSFLRNQHNSEVSPFAEDARTRAMLEGTMEPRLSPAKRLFLISFTAVSSLLLASSALPRSSKVQASSDRQHQGAELFASSGCAHCHGDDGQGTDNAPSLRNARKHLKPQQIQRQIVHGGKEMPAFGDTLSKDQVKSLVEFLHAKTWITLPKPAPNAKPAAPSDPQAPGA